VFSMASSLSNIFLFCPFSLSGFSRTFLLSWLKPDFYYYLFLPPPIDNKEKYRSRCKKDTL
jgi:hypothetical protein